MEINPWSRNIRVHWLGSLGERTAWSGWAIQTERQTRRAFGTILPRSHLHRLHFPAGAFVRFRNNTNLCSGDHARFRAVLAMLCTPPSQGMVVQNPDSLRALASRSRVTSNPLYSLFGPSLRAPQCWDRLSRPRGQSCRRRCHDQRLPKFSFWMSVTCTL